MVDQLTDIAEQAVDIMDQEFEENAPDFFKGNMSYLQTSASVFYNEIAEVWSRIQNINYMKKQEYKIKRLIKAEKETEASVVQEELKNYHLAVVSKAEFANFTTKVFKFQEVVNAVLGQKVQMIYVYIDKKGNPTLYKLENTGDHLKQSFASKGRGMSARYGNLSQSFLNTHGEKILNSLKNNGQEQLDLAYKETVKRGQYSKKVLKIGFLLVLWQPMKIWLKMKISAQGDINEAYAAFYLNMIYNNFIFDKNPDIEWLLNTFLLHDQYGVTAVDSISGFFEGDVSINNIEYAIKSKGATSLSPEQVIRLAETIKDMSSEELTMEYIENLKREAHQAGKRRNLVEPLDVNLNLTYDEIVKSLSDKYGKKESEIKLVL